ncbi:RND family efflux transporter MFP subunit [Anaerobacterium chartisolvens]|uniref:RND family efflux transporter MFP subunit n=1 Tax=Anaerobacterium chartisolvens TaxID=1297424 RepID=A0A369AIC8_9FIRM|nr:efflux RND transporter periplasmic adaptor subunit [Anaerobacterium chartisolvens]RCX08088.1 RND family efflux transporter MFP subunit [Anaerobacterium chartisolvens]
MNFFKKNKLLCIAISVISLTSMTGCGQQAPSSAPVVKNVSALQVSAGSIATSVDYAGKLKPLKEIPVASKLPGTVESVNYDVGMEVREGDILFTIDPKEVQAQYDQSKAAVNSAETNLTLTSESTIAQQILQAEKALAQAQIQYDDAAELYGKMAELYGSNSASRQDMDKSKSAMDAALIQLNTAKNFLELLNNKVGPQSAAVASAQLEQSKAAQKQSSIRLDNTSVASPISGRVSARSIDAGQLLSAGIPVFTIIDSSAYLAEVNVSNAIVSRILAGQKVSVKAGGASESVYGGVVDTISPSADPQTHTYTVKVKIQNTSPDLIPGMLVKVNFTVDSRNNIIIVPNEAVVSENGVQYVYVVKDNKIVKRLVSTGISDEKSWEITDGIKAGEYVVTEGQSFLNEGDSVNIS